MNAHHGLRFVLAIAALVLSGMLPARATSSAVVDGLAGQVPAGEIDPALLKTIESEGSADFFVVLAEKADLSGADAFSEKAERGAYVFETLVQTAETTQAGLRQLLAAQGFEFRPFYIANAILVRDGTEALITQLAARPDVAELIPDRSFQIDRPPISPKLPTIPGDVGGNIAFVNADDVWGMGIDGDGIVLAANDTGLSWDHPAIIDHYRGWDGSSADHNYNWWDPTGSYPLVPGDGFGHGTHVTGTMVGDDGAGNRIGMAPGSQTIHCKNLDDGGSGLDSWILECFEWDLAPWDLAGQNPDPGMAPHAVNNSWGFFGGGNTVFIDAIANLQAAGILVEVSAGNEGPSCATLRSPGDYGEVMTTGSVSWDGQDLPGSLSFFSSRGPSTLGPDFLPDVTAPGENVRSSLPGGGYENWDGTSMAGPHVVGLVGLMWSANPGLRGLIDITNQLIFGTSIPLTGQTGSNCGGDYVFGPNHDWGYGTIDSLAAVEAAISFGGVGTLMGTVTDAATADPLSGVPVQAVGEALTFHTTTGDGGVYSRLVFSGTYTVTASLYGYFPETVTGVDVFEDETTVVDFALDPAPKHTVSGTVTDSITGWPLYASIEIDGYPFGPVFTDPETGGYSVDLAAGIEYTFNVSGVLPGYLTESRPVGPLDGDQTEDFTLNADAFVCSAPGYQPLYAYFENFEDGDGGYTVDGIGSWAWGTPTTGPGSAHSGENAWATNLNGNYFDGESSFLVSPAIDLSAFAGQRILLDWWQWLVTEEGFDFATVEVSKDDGSSWAIVRGPDSGEVNPGWTKNSTLLDSSYATAGLRIRFGFTSDFSATYPGFYIDDVGFGVVVEPPALYEQDFEADNGGFTISGTTSWEWGTPTKGPGSAHSGASAWATDLDDDYGNNESGYLTSPAIDLTGAAGNTIRVAWWQWLQTESGYDFASVEVFDGRQWVQLIHTSGPLDLEWARVELFLSPEFAVPNFAIRFGLETDGSVNYPGFHIDDLRIDLFTDIPPSVGCEAQPGGLVVGYVTDLNTGDPVVGAQVSSDDGVGFSMVTPDDPALDDGFYTVFAAPGPQDVTASSPNYGSVTETPVVPDGGVVWQGFELPAALLSSDPAQVEATLDMGSQVTVTIRLENEGDAATDFTIGEQPGGFTPAFPLSVWVPGAGQGESLSGSYLDVSGIRTAPAAPFFYTVPAGAPLSSVTINVLLLAASPVDQISALLGAYPDLAVSSFDAGAGTPSLAELEAYDAVVLISNFSFADPVAIGDVLADFADVGGAVVQTVPTFFDPGGFGWGVQGRWLDEGYSPFIGLGDWFSDAQLADFDPSHPIMEGVVFASDFFRQIVDLAPGSEWVADWADDEFIATKGSTVALNTFLADDGAWSGDIPLIVHNSIVFAATGQDVPWLVTQPITGTVPANDSIDIAVGFDSGVPEIVQPGIYTAVLNIKNDSPYGSLVVPVTMNVNPPQDWGKLYGTVTSQGYCDVGGGPIDGAVVDIEGAALTGTDQAGEYAYWLPAGTYQVTITAGDHVGQTLEAEVAAGGETVLDAALRLDAPCSSLAPGELVFILPVNVQAGDTLSLENTGAGLLTFEVFESEVDLSSGSAPVDLGVAAGPSGPIQTGSASALGQTWSPTAGGEDPLSGWFGALNHPEGIIRYAFAQCGEQPESFYVFGGVSGFDFNVSESAWRYDAASNSWTELAPMFYGSEAPSGTCYQGRIYILGGSGTTDMQIYNIATDEWTIGAPLPRGMEGAAVGAWDGKVYMAGGDDDFTPNTGVSDQVDVYDIAADAWIGTGAPMPAGVGNAGFVQAGQHLYVVGGWGETAPDLNSHLTLRYDMAGDAWETGPEFTSGRADFALAMTEGALYAIGGDADAGFFFDGSNLFESLDLSGWPGGAWADLSDPLPQALTANQAGFCTEALFDPEAAEVWSVGGIDTAVFTIEGSNFFWETGGERCYSIYTDVPWLSVSPTSGEVEATTGVAELEVLVDTTGLSPGAYTATIVVITNDPGRPQLVVKVTLIVGGAGTIYLPVIIR
ncbi:MAG TPA: S8 family serine peptidase [Anaerolineales bacterium]|nr:S8 family serine peptidase [Anaerolineales bacterium]